MASTTLGAGDTGVNRTKEISAFRDVAFLRGIPQRVISVLSPSASAASFPTPSFKVLMLKQHGQLMSCLVQELVNGRDRCDGACVIPLLRLWLSLSYSPEMDNIQELCQWRLKRTIFSGLFTTFSLWQHSRLNNALLSTPKDVKDLTPRTWVCVTLHSERNFATVTTLRVLRWRSCPALSGWPHVITKSL